MAEDKPDDSEEEGIVPDLDDEELDDEELDDEELDDENFGGELPVDDDAAAAVVADDDDDDEPAESGPRRPVGDDEDDDEPDPDDVEADLDTILKDRIASGEDEDDDDEESTPAPAAPVAKGEPVIPKRDGEWTCEGCFFIVSPSQFGSKSSPRCPFGEDPCPSLERVIG